MGRDAIMALLASLALLFPLSCSPLRARQFQKSLPVEPLVHKLSFSEDSSSLSPDSQWFAYTIQDPRRVGTIDEELHPWGVDITRSRGYDIWMTNTQSGHSKNLTGGIGANWAPAWSPDGRYLAFYSTRTGNVTLWIYEMRSANLTQVSDAVIRPLGSRVVRWTGDSKKVLTRIASQDLPPKEAREYPVVSKETYKGQTNEASSAVIIYRSSPRTKNNPPVSRDGANVVEDSRTRAARADLALVDVKTGKVDQIAHGFNPEWYDISPDGSAFAFATWKGTLAGSANRNVFDLVFVSKGQPRVIAANIIRRAREFWASWSPDGRWLSYVATEGHSEGECYIVSVNGGTPRRATMETHPAFNEWTGTAPLWDPSGHHLYLLASFDAVWQVSLGGGKAREIARIPDGRIYSIVAPMNESQFWSPDGGRSLIVSFGDVLTKECGFYRIDLSTGAATELLRQDKFYENFHHRVSYSTNGQKLVYFAQDAGHEPNFWIVDSGFQETHQLTHINPWLDSYAMGTSKLIEWQTLDGQTIRGALLLPAGYEEGKKYPLIVNVYGGGGLSGNLNSFGLNPVPDYPPRNLQLFATRGYAVLCPDSPLGVGAPMSDLAKTVLPGVNKVIELGIAAPDKLGVMGVSYGGYHMLSLIVQTPRFKAAIMISGFGDLVGMSGEMDKDGVSLGELIREPWGPWGRMPGEPWEYPQPYIQNSPVFYLDRVQTPLLIVHGASDRNVVPFLADQVFVFLRRLGREVVYAKYEGEGHTISAPTNQIDLCNRLIAWFDEHLRSGEGSKGP